eukprot:g127.t1
MIPLKIRPQTARTISRPSIQDLVSGKGGKALPDSDRIVRTLRRDIEQTLYDKKNKLDTLKFQLKGRKAEVGRLRMKLKELMTDGDALGVNQRYKGRKRLEANPSVSMRPIFHCQTDLGDLVQKVEKKRLEIKIANFRKRQYNYMIEENLKVAERKLRQENKQLLAQVNEEKRSCLEAQKMLIGLKEKLAAVNLDTRSVRRQMRKEEVMWIDEIAKRKAAFLQKKKVADFYKEMMTKQQMIEHDDGTDLTAEEEARLLEARARSVIAEEEAEKKHGEAHANALEEEAKYRQFFVECGLESADNYAIYNKMQEHESNTKRLRAQQDNLDADIEAHKATIRSIGAKMTANTTEKSSRRPILSKMETALANLVKESETLNEKRNALRKVTSSIEIALGVMGEKYVGDHFDKDFCDDAELLCGVLAKRIEHIAAITTLGSHDPFLNTLHRRLNSTLPTTRGGGRRGRGYSGSGSTISPPQQSSSVPSPSKRSGVRDLVSESIDMHRKSQEFLASHVLSQAMIQSATSLQCEVSPHNVRINSDVKNRQREKFRKGGIRDFLLHDVYSNLSADRDAQKRKSRTAVVSKKKYHHGKVCAKKKRIVAAYRSGAKGKKSRGPRTRSNTGSARSNHFGGKKRVARIGAAESKRSIERSTTTIF